MRNIHCNHVAGGTPFALRKTEAFPELSTSNNHKVDDMTTIVADFCTSPSTSSSNSCE